MDVLIKKNDEIEELDPSSVNLEVLIFEPEVKWIKEEIVTIDDEQCTSKPIPAVFKCELCTYKTLQKQRLDVHLKTHSPDPLVIIKDEICDPEVQMKHEEIMVEDKELDLQINFKCEICDYETSQTLELESHIESHRQGLVGSSSDHVSDPPIKILAAAKHSFLPKIKQKMGLSEKIFTCKLCNYKTLQKQRYEAHIRSHMGGTCFKCTECDFFTPSCDSLHRHKLNHTFKCLWCDYKAASKHYLNLHMKMHSPLHKFFFKCEHCPYETLYKGALIHHKQRHYSKELPLNNTVSLNEDNQFPSHVHLNFDRVRDEERSKKTDMPFKCDECSYKTLRKDYLDRHMVFHHKNKVFGCSECGQKFALQRSLLLHVKNHVKQED